MSCEKNHQPAAAAHIQFAQDVGRYILSVAVLCDACGKRFRFLGAQPGIDFDGVRASVDGLELHVGIAPNGEPVPPVPVKGFGIVGDANG